MSSGGWVQPRRDRAFLANQVSDFHARVIAPGVLIVPDLPPNSAYDTLYQEEATYNDALRRGKRFEVSVKSLANPSPKILKKYGIDQHRSVQLGFPVEALKKLGFSRVEVGWVFIFLSETYRITEFFQQAYTDHHDSFLYWIGFAVKQRFSSLEQDPETILSPSADTTFGGKRDARFLSQMTGSFTARVIPNVLLFERPNDEAIDLLYAEDLPNFFTWNRYSVPIYTRWDAQDDKFRKAGIEETRTVKFSISVAAFEKLEVPIPDVGSVFVIEGEFYRMNDIHPVGYIGTTGAHYEMEGSGWKVKPSSLPGAFDPVVDLRAVSKNTFLLPIQDVAFLASGQADLFRRSFDVVSFFVRDRTFNIRTILDSNGLVHPDRFREEVRSVSPQLDLLYNEDIANYRIPGTKFDLPAYVKVNPTEITLKKYGITTDRDIMVWLSIALLDKSGFDVLPNFGDIFIYMGEYYQVTNQDPSYYYSNTERYVSIAVFGRKMRQSSLETGPLVQEPPLGEESTISYVKEKGALDPLPNAKLTDDLYGEPK